MMKKKKITKKKINWKKIIAIRNSITKYLESHFPQCTITEPGIYIYLWLSDIDGNCCYVGQAKNIKNRTIQHFLWAYGVKNSHPQRVDLAIMKHRKEKDFNIIVIQEPEWDLDNAEIEWSGIYKELGYNVTNKFAGQIRKIRI